MPNGNGTVRGHTLPNSVEAIAYPAEGGRLQLKWW